MEDGALISKEYILIIDTDTKTEGFYRQLCGFCTGYDHESINTTEFSDLFYSDESISGDDENPFSSIISYCVDQNGYDSPCSVWLNKSWGRDSAGNYRRLSEQNFSDLVEPAPFSVGLFFTDHPRDVVGLIKKRAEAFFKVMNYPVAIEGFRLIVHSKYAAELPLE